MSDGDIFRRLHNRMTFDFSIIIPICIYEFFWKGVTEKCIGVDFKQSDSREG